MTTHPTCSIRFWRALLCLVWTSALLLPPSLRAEYLPDAATHLGTVVINQDAHFTTDQLVTLSIYAADTGSGIAQMQFSNDGQNWSPAEAYATSKSHPLTVAAEDYPPRMNTVLKTVYVRVKYGNGTWSKAFTDGIVFAKSAQDIPLSKDVWVMQQRPSPYDGAQPVGSQLNPYIIPPGANQPAFDTLMNTLAKTYGYYRSKPNEYETNPPPMNNITVMFLHIGPGTYLTHGDNGGRNLIQSWSPTAGGRIRGAGKDATILKLVGGNTNTFAHVLGNYGGNGMGIYDSLEISDLTVDANMHEGGNITGYWLRTGVTLSGNNAQLRRLRVMGFGSRIAGIEPGGMTGFNAGAGNVYNFHIEDCEVVAPQRVNSYLPLMMGYQGGGRDAQGNLMYLHNLVIRNNYINGLMYDQSVALNAYTNAFRERASHGITLGGCTNSVVEDNYVVHVMSGYYNDTFDLANVRVRNNHFRDVISGLNFGTGAAESLRFEGNLVELDPHYYTTPASGSTGPSDFGWRTGMILNENYRAPINRALIYSNLVQFTDRVAPTAPLSGSFAIASLSGSADFSGNMAVGLNRRPIRWYQSEGPPLTYFGQQADILAPTKPAPVITMNNRHEDGTIIEVYPYVLEQALPRPVVVPNQSITFPAPLINGNIPGMVTGLPVTNVIDNAGNFSWTPTEKDIGRYVVSFYDSVNRTNDPRRTLITVQDGLSDQDLLLFSGLKGYWKLGDDVGNRFLDFSGNGNHLTLVPPAQNYLARGVPGRRPGQKALHFENNNIYKAATLTLSNKNAALINGFPFAYHPYLQRSTQLTKPFTLAYWFKPEHQPTNQEVIFNYGSQVICGVGPGPATNASLAEVFCTFSHSPDLTFYQGLHPQSYPVQIGAWHQLVFVYDGVSTRLYVNGAKREEIPCGQIEDFDVSNLIYLGGGWFGDNYLGALSDLAIWNRPLSDAEVAGWFASQQSGAGFPALQAPSNLGFTP